MNEVTRKANSSLLGLPGRGAQEGASKRRTRRQGCAGRRQMLWLRWATGTCIVCPGAWLLNSVLRSCETRQSASLPGGGDSCGHKCGIHLLIKAAQDRGSLRWFLLAACAGRLCRSWAQAECQRCSRAQDKGSPETQELQPEGEALASCCGGRGQWHVYRRQAPHRRGTVNSAAHGAVVEAHRYFPKELQFLVALALCRKPVCNPTGCLKPLRHPQSVSGDVIPSWQLGEFLVCTFILI